MKRETSYPAIAMTEPYQPPQVALQTPRMTVLLRVLACAYTYGAIVHLFDFLGLGEMPDPIPLSWRIADIYYGIFDGVAALGLWQKRMWGVVTFCTLAVSQLIVYLAFPRVFALTSEHQQLLWTMVAFDGLSLTLFFSLLWQFQRQSTPTNKQT